MTAYADRVEGLGTAGAAAGGVMTVQGAAGGLVLPDDVRQWGGVAVTAAALVGDALGQPTGPLVGAIGLLINRSTGLERRASEAGTDAQAGTGIAGVNPMVWNGATFDLARFPASGPTLVATGSSAANTAQTVTIAAPGAGLRIYITDLWIGQFSAAALAGTAGLTITSVGLNGRAWSLGNGMAAGDTRIVVEQNGQPLMAAQAAASLVSITYPACGASVASRIVIGYVIA